MLSLLGPPRRQSKEDPRKGFHAPSILREELPRHLAMKARLNGLIPSLFELTQPLIQRRLR